MQPLTILTIMFVLSLPITILLDSKLRLGKLRWGWALISIYVLMSVIPTIGHISLPENIGYFLGGIIGAWVGFFLLYKMITSKKTTDQSETGQTTSSNTIINKSGDSTGSNEEQLSKVCLKVAGAWFIFGVGGILMHFDRSAIELLWGVAVVLTCIGVYLKIINK